MFKNICKFNILRKCSFACLTEAGMRFQIQSVNVCFGLVSSWKRFFDLLKKDSVICKPTVWSPAGFLCQSGEAARYLQAQRNVAFWSRRFCLIQKKSKQLGERRAFPHPLLSFCPAVAPAGDLLREPGRLQRDPADGRWVKKKPQSAAAAGSLPPPRLCTFYFPAKGEQRA